MNTTDKRRIGILLGLAVAVVLLLLGLAGRESLPQVLVAPVSRENLDTSIMSNGKVEPIEPHTIRAQFTTFVEQVYGVEGQTVKRGKLLLTLDAAASRAELAQRREEMLTAEEQLRAARAGGPPDEVAKLESDRRQVEVELNHRRRERETLERLFAKQAATRDELDQNRLALDRAEAQWKLVEEKKAALDRRVKLDIERATLLVEHARNAVRVLEEKVRSAQVTAPVDGTLYSLPVRRGDYVREGSVLAEVADLGRARVRAFVDEPELGWLEEGQTAEITWDAAPNRVWSGRTEVIPKAVVARGTRSVGEVLCSVDNQKLELLPNTNVNVRIRVRERAQALVVPRGAVRGEGAQRYVFVVAGNKLRRRPIKVGIASASKYEIGDGLAEGDRVVLPGDIELRDGMEVRALEQK